MDDIVPWGVGFSNFRQACGVSFVGGFLRQIGILSSGAYRVRQPN